MSNEIKLGHRRNDRGALEIYDVVSGNSVAGITSHTICEEVKTAAFGIISFFLHNESEDKYEGTNDQKFAKSSIKMISIPIERFNELESAVKERDEMIVKMARCVIQFGDISGWPQHVKELCERIPELRERIYK